MKQDYTAKLQHGNRAFERGIEIAYFFVLSESRPDLKKIAVSSACEEYLIAIMFNTVNCKTNLISKILSIFLLQQRL